MAKFIRYVSIPGTPVMFAALVREVTVDDLIIDTKKITISPVFGPATTEITAYCPVDIHVDDFPHRLQKRWTAGLEFIKEVVKLDWENVDYPSQYVTAKENEVRAKLLFMIEQKDPATFATALKGINKKIHTSINEDCDTARRFLLSRYNHQHMPEQTFDALKVSLTPDKRQEIIDKSNEIKTLFSEIDRINDLIAVKSKVIQTLQRDMINGFMTNEEQS